MSTLFAGFVGGTAVWVLAMGGINLVRKIRRAREEAYWQRWWAEREERNRRVFRG